MISLSYEKFLDMEQVLGADQQEFKRQKEQYDRKEAEYEQLIRETTIFFREEARNVIEQYLDRYDLSGRYEIEDANIICVCNFLVACHQNDAAHRLPEQVRDRVIQMYMGLIDADRIFLDQVYRMLEARD